MTQYEVNGRTFNLLNDAHQYAAQLNALICGAAYYPTELENSAPVAVWSEIYVSEGHIGAGRGMRRIPIRDWNRLGQKTARGYKLLVERLIKERDSEFSRARKAEDELKTVTAQRDAAIIANSLLKREYDAPA